MAGLAERPTPALPWHSDPPPLARKRVTHTDEASVAAEVDVGPVVGGLAPERR